MDKTKHKIVIVEDDAPIREIYEFKLKLEDFDVRTANDGVEGLKVIQDFKPALVLLDLKMPNLSGEDMLEKLRTYSWGANIRVLVLTNISKDEAPAKLRLLNVDRYIVKAHYTPQQIVDIVRKVLA